MCMCYNWMNDCQTEVTANKHNYFLCLIILVSTFFTDLLELVISLITLHYCFLVV